MMANNQAASGSTVNVPAAVQTRLVIVGATGMVGGYALRYALDHPAVKHVTAIGRRKLDISHPKLKEVLHQDFADCSALAEPLSGQDAAVFCLGAYTGAVPDAELRTITVDYTIEFARVLRGSSPDARFSFLSGSGADPTGQSRMAFARYKGEAEKALLAAGFSRVYLFRPAYIYPVEPRKEPNFSYRLLRAIYPAFRVLFPNQVIRADDLARAMVDLAVRGTGKGPGLVLENRDIMLRGQASMYKDSGHMEPPQEVGDEPLSSSRGTPRNVEHQSEAVTTHPWKGNKAVSPSNPIVSVNAEILEQPTKEQEKAEVAALLATETFRRSPKLSRLLSYLCDKYFAGEADGLKEYCIAVDVLGRDSEFDPQLDAAVRVDTHYLRKRLKKCYATEARDHRVQIVIPKGQYIPQFLLRSEPEISRPAQARWPWLSLALVVAGVGAVLWMTIARPWHRPAKTETGIQNVPAGAAVAKATASPGATAVVPVPLSPASEPIRILAGERRGNYVDKAGRVWLPDRYFAGGTTFHHVSSEIARTQDPDIFQRGREGQFAYEIPLNPGIYELHLYFAETMVGSEGLRTVSLSINGLPVSGLDVALDAGGVNIAAEKIFKDISPAKDGLLHLSFQGAGPNGFVNALEILPGTAGKMLPVRLTMQDSPYRDHLGRIWMPDQYFLSGRRHTGKMPSEHIDGTADPELFSTYRYGNFTYSIPVVEGGKYTITLYFAETWFTSPDSQGGIGNRVFDVYCNGQTLLKDFDILKETGGAGNRPVVKVFHNIPSSAQGTLNLTFVPTKNYALVSAIEVTEE